jgi:hypothetical protein
VRAPSAIAQRLNKEGCRTGRGRKFGRKAVLHILRNPFYIGHFRWQKEAFDEPAPADHLRRHFRCGQRHPADSRSEESHRASGGTTRTSGCSPAWSAAAAAVQRMVGVSGNKKGQKHSYYACSKRLESKECDQDYVRADWIETADPRRHPESLPGRGAAGGNLAGGSGAAGSQRRPRN